MQAHRNQQVSYSCFYPSWLLIQFSCLFYFVFDPSINSNLLFVLSQACCFLETILNGFHPLHRQLLNPDILHSSWRRILLGWQLLLLLFAYPMTLFVFVANILEKANQEIIDPFFVSFVSICLLYVTVSKIVYCYSISNQITLLSMQLPTVEPLDRIEIVGMSNDYASLTEQYECAVCYETTGQFKRLHCGHYYHLHCIQAWYSSQQVNSSLCPTCRQAI